MVRWLVQVLNNSCSRPVYFWARMNSAPQWMILCSQFISVMSRVKATLMWHWRNHLTVWRGAKSLALCGHWSSSHNGSQLILRYNQLFGGNRELLCARSALCKPRCSSGSRLGGLVATDSGSQLQYYSSNRRYKGKWRNDRTDREITRLGDKHLWLMAVMLHKS